MEHSGDAAPNVPRNPCRPQHVLVEVIIILPKGGRLYSGLNSIGFRVYGLPSENEEWLDKCGCGEHASRGSDFVG